MEQFRDAGGQDKRGSPRENGDQRGWAEGMKGGAGAGGDGEAPRGRAPTGKDSKAPSGRETQSETQTQ